jgi:hypothetical protein
MLVPQVARAMRAPAAMMMPDTAARALPSTSRASLATGSWPSQRSRQGGGQDRVKTVTRTHVPINIGGARLTDLLITNSDSIVEVNEYLDNRRR